MAINYSDAAARRLSNSAPQAAAQNPFMRMVATQKVTEADMRKDPETGEIYDRSKRTGPLDVAPIEGDVNQRKDPMTGELYTPSSQPAIKSAPKGSISPVQFIKSLNLGKMGSHGNWNEAVMDKNGKQIGRWSTNLGHFDHFLSKGNAYGDTKAYDDLMSDVSKVIKSNKLSDTEKRTAAFRLVEAMHLRGGNQFYNNYGGALNYDDPESDKIRSQNNPSILDVAKYIESRQGGDLFSRI